MMLQPYTGIVACSRGSGSSTTPCWSPTIWCPSIRPELCLPALAPSARPMHFGGYAARPNAGAIVYARLATIPPCSTRLSMKRGRASRDEVSG
jgi:hypothetical protein